MNRRLLQRDIPGMGETAVTGYDFGQWASAAKRLLEHGHSFVFAQPNETDGYDVINEADAKEYIPIGMELEIDGRKFVIDSVNFGADEVSLRDVTFKTGRAFPSSALNTLRLYARLLKNRNRSNRSLSPNPSRSILPRKRTCPTT